MTLSDVSCDMINDVVPDELSCSASVCVDPSLLPRYRASLPKARPHRQDQSQFAHESSEPHNLRRSANEIHAGRSHIYLLAPTQSTRASIIIISRTTSSLASAGVVLCSFPSTMAA